MEGSGGGAPLSAGALLGEPRGGSFLWIRKDMWRRAQGTDITLRGDPTADFAGALLPGT